MTVTQQIITIAMVILGTVITRALPFFIFKEGQETPRFIQYLGKYLPGAVFAMLVVYCLKGVSLTSAPFGIPEMVGRYWFKTFDSVSSRAGCYSGNDCS